ncbi:hypothetical protein SISSUDRAFT_1044469 [Sistotremastrum suecicum HHB10207 ss-3]|uniref:BTB domain-containing protein n=1 Tax=Sistotremastrum suecicum HHB10207 ss-3 TaxID=1314776 RepID=A0A166F3F2_9AGAM|nr:hypothetical protein SISSUDRAFT_1044469 [Sistotremastrum suecicum HHB10207 ss-3]
MSASRDTTADAQNAQPAPLLSPLSYNDGDIVIHSSDKTVFKLHKIVLSLASQVFRCHWTKPPRSAPRPRIHSLLSTSRNHPRCSTASFVSYIPLIHPTSVPWISSPTY